MKDIFVVVPTLNPNLALFEPFLEELQKEFKNILVVNDGCKSEYKSFFATLEDKNILVFNHYVNMGKGRALKDAYNYLLDVYPKLKGVVTADSDGQHSVKDIKNIAQKVLENNDALIIGVRDFNLSHVPKRNRFGNKITSKVLKLFTGVKVSDTQTGLRGLPRNVMMKVLTVPGERFEYETNQLIETKYLNIPIIEEKIETIYFKDSNSESHFNPIKDSIAIYKVFFRYIFSSGSSFILDILLFMLFKSFIGGANAILISTIIARVLSSFYNYKINASLVFKNQSKGSIIKYFLLCIVQMLVSGSLVQLLDNIFNIQTVLLKIIIDMVIFIVNFIIQREIVFKNEKK